MVALHVTYVREVPGAVRTFSAASVPRSLRGHGWFEPFQSSSQVFTFITQGAADKASDADAPEESDW